MNDKQIQALLKRGSVGKYSVGDGLYFRVTKEGTGLWVVRYSLNNRRPEITIGRYEKNKQNGMSLADAKLEASRIRSEVRKGNDPILQRKRAKQINLTVHQVAERWLEDKKEKVKHPEIPMRVFKKDIAPVIGNYSIQDVSPMDIEEVLKNIRNSGRPTIANDALRYCKEIFQYAVKRGLRNINPAASLTTDDAGGKESPRTRALTLDEIENVYKVFDTYSNEFTRDNYLAISLILLLGVRKGELIGACWSEIDFSKQTWTIPRERTKTKSDITIPLSTLCICLLRELHIRACGSDYVFPTRGGSKRRGFISSDTLNQALLGLFGKKKERGGKKPQNRFEKSGVEYFTVHDLRRTFRTLLSMLKVPAHIAERCLNHKLKGILEVYDKYDYFDERKEALDLLSKTLSSFIKAHPSF